MGSDFKPMLKPVDIDPASIRKVGDDGQTGGPMPGSVSPIPGFLARAGAMLIDVGLLTLICYALCRSAFEILYPIRWIAQMLAVFGVYVYFWVSASRITSGRSVGRWVTGLRVVRTDGESPKLGQAALRALPVQFVVVAIASVALWAGVIFMNMRPRMLIDFGGPETYVFVFNDILVKIGFAYAMATSVFVTLHPKKRAPHDLLSNTLVVRADQEQEAIEMLGMWNEHCQIRQKLAVYPSVLIAAIVLLWGGLRANDLAEEVESQMGPLRDARQALEAHEGYRLQALMGPRRQHFQEARRFLLEKAIEQLEKGQQRAAPSMFQEPPLNITTTTLRLSPAGRRFVFLLEADAVMTSETLYQDPRYQLVRDALIDLAEDLSIEHYTDEDGPAPWNRIQIEVGNSLPLYLYASGQRAGVEVLDVEGHLPPDAPPLVSNAALSVLANPTSPTASGVTTTTLYAELARITTPTQTVSPEDAR